MGRPWVHAPGRFLGDVEELTGGDVAPHPGVFRAHDRGLRVIGDTGLHEVVAPGDEQISQQDRRRAPEGVGVARPAGLEMRALEGAVRGGTAASGVGVVDQIVVHESRGLEDLQGGAQVPERFALHGIPVVETGDRTPSGVAESRPEPLAADESAGGRVEERDRISTVLRGLGAHPAEEELQTLGDGIWDEGGGGHDSQHTYTQRRARRLAQTAGGA